MEVKNRDSGRKKDAAKRRLLLLLIMPEQASEFKNTGDNLKKVTASNN